MADRSRPPRPGPLPDHIPLAEAADAVNRPENKIADLDSSPDT
ncbi:hypothetical protein ACFXMT_07190 [Streptomyces mirabilis]